MSETPAITINELVAQYCRYELPELVPTSQKHRERWLAAFAREFGVRAWDGVHRSEVQEWIRNTERWKSEHTMRSVAHAIKRLYTWAHEDDRIPRNVMRALRFSEGIPRRSMAEDEYRKLLRSFHAYFRRVLVFVRETGCRPQDVANLDWSMIRWDEGVAFLPEHKTLKKTGKPRTLYLSALVLRLLAWMKRQRDQLPDLGPSVFLNRYGRRWTSNALTMALYRARHLCRLADGCVLYGLRHFLANRLQAAGVDIRTTADILGHGSITTTQRHYLHSLERTESTRAALERVSGHKPRKPKS